MEERTIEVGHKVMWRGSWGRDIAKEATIVSIDLCAAEGDKYGIPTEKVWASDKNRCCFGLDTGNWAYGYQIELIDLEKTKEEKL